MKLTEIQERWLQELETTDKAQGDGWLKREENGEIKYCCLGIAAEILGIEGEVGCFLENPYWTFNGEDVYLLDYEKLGLRSGYGLLEGQDIEETTLADMNDNGWSFKEIAKFCRENPEVVFVNPEAV